MEDKWADLFERIDACRNCELCKTRINTVPGMGNPEADIMFVGEAPGAEEDYQGRPFVGASGQLLDQMMNSIHLNRENTYITNIIKCRPPRNRTPLPEEAQVCMPYFREQVRLVRPKIIVALGATAAKYLIDSNIAITKQRGIWVERKGLHMIATFHPSYLLRDQSQKRLAWADFKSIRDKMKELGISPERSTDDE
ncbi:MAG: uracil-DNA glycosylase [Clostridiales bacterium]|nr:uracil-DNA glycosylase [Clostridiales bacterium]